MLAVLLDSLHLRDTSDGLDLLIGVLHLLGEHPATPYMAGLLEVERKVVKMSKDKQKTVKGYHGTYRIHELS